MHEEVEEPKTQYALLVDPHTGQEFNLCRFATSIGRSISGDVVLTDKSVSRQHAIVYCLKGKFHIEDVGSTNGTIVNGKIIQQRTLLHSGDEIRLGISKLLFLLIPNRSAVLTPIAQEPTSPLEKPAPGIKEVSPAEGTQDGSLAEALSGNESPVRGQIRTTPKGD